MANEFLDFYRNLFSGQNNQASAEKKAEKAEAKAAQATAEAEKAQEEAKTAIDLSEAKEKVTSFLNNLRSAIENAAKEAAKKSETTTETTEIKTEAPDDGNTIEYTYQAGDTFGQVIKSLGLESGSGLWGSDGDVAYYTKQLADQGALDNRGNIPIGTKIKLRRRGAPEIVMAEEQTETPTGVTGVTYDAILPRQTVTTKTPRRV